EGPLGARTPLGGVEEREDGRALSGAGRAADEVGVEREVRVRPERAMEAREVDARALERAAREREREVEATEERAEPRVAALRVAVGRGVRERRVAHARERAGEGGAPG